MGAPYYSPSGGIGSTHTDKNTGVTYRFNGSGWDPISSGAKQNASYGSINPSSGSVKGASTGGSSGGGGTNMKDPNANPGSNYFWDAADGWKLKEDPGINWDQIKGSVFSELDKSIGIAEEGAREQTRGVEDIYGVQSKRLGEKQQEQQQRLDTYRGEAVENKDRTLRDLAVDLKNALQAGQVYLGGLGAGSSSAVGRMSGALAKGANRRSTAVENQFGGILNEINMKRADVDSAARDAMLELDTWKNSEISRIASELNNVRMQMQNMRADVSRSFSEQFINSKLGELAAIQQQHRNYQNAIAEWGLSRAQNVGQAIGAMNTAATYQMPGIGYQGFGGFSASGRGPSVRYFGGAGSDEELI